MDEHEVMERAADRALADPRLRDWERAAVAALARSEAAELEARRRLAAARAELYVRALGRELERLGLVPRDGEYEIAEPVQEPGDVAWCRDGWRFGLAYDHAAGDLVLCVASPRGCGGWVRELADLGRLVLEDLAERDLEAEPCAG